MRVLAQGIDSTRAKHTGPQNDAVDLVALSEQSFQEIRPILSRDPHNQSFFTTTNLLVQPFFFSTRPNLVLNTHETSLLRPNPSVPPTAFPSARPLLNDPAESLLDSLAKQDA